MIEPRIRKERPHLVRALFEGANHRRRQKYPAISRWHGISNPRNIARLRHSSNEKRAADAKSVDGGVCCMYLFAFRMAPDTEG